MKATLEVVRIVHLLGWLHFAGLWVGYLRKRLFYCVLNVASSKKLLFETFYRPRWNSFCHLYSLPPGKSTLKSLTCWERILCSLEKQTSSSFESPCFYSLFTFLGEITPPSPVMSREELFQKHHYCPWEKKRLVVDRKNKIKKEIFMKPESDKYHKLKLPEIL